MEKWKSSNIISDHDCLYYDIKYLLECQIDYEKIFANFEPLPLPLPDEYVGEVFSSEGYALIYDEFSNEWFPHFYHEIVEAWAEEKFDCDADLMREFVEDKMKQYDAFRRGQNSTPKGK
ncbi:MAG: hypothetical protein HC788_13455 [Sphingopyxis sp.]|nr:hypothetical protein [Sphingopyxis sp.]